MKIEFNVRKTLVLATGLLILIGLIFFLLIQYSHYTFDKKMRKYVIEESILIHAPIEKVFQYTGSPVNLNVCLSYAEKIKVLDSAGKHPDNIGTLKRYYCHFDEQNEFWDCKTKDLIRNKKRVFEVFNITGLPLHTHRLCFEHQFEKVGHEQTRVRLVMYYPQNDPGKMEIFKAHLASYRINAMFRETLNKIKINLETINSRQVAKRF